MARLGVVAGLALLASLLALTQYTFAIVAEAGKANVTPGVVWPSSIVYDLYGKPILVSYPQLHPNVSTVELLYPASWVNSSTFVCLVSVGDHDVIGVASFSGKPSFTPIVSTLSHVPPGFMVFDKLFNASLVVAADEDSQVYVVDLRSNSVRYIQGFCREITRLAASSNTLLLFCRRAGVMALYHIPTNTYTVYTPKNLGTMIPSSHMPRIVDADMAWSQCGSNLCRGGLIAFLVQDYFTLEIRLRMKDTMLPPPRENVSEVVLVIVTPEEEQYMIRLGLESGGIARVNLPLIPRFTLVVYVPWKNVTKVGNETKVEEYYLYYLFPDLEAKPKLVVNVTIDPQSPYRVKVLPDIPEKMPTGRPRLFVSYYEAGHLTTPVEVVLPANYTVKRILGGYSFKVFEGDGFKYMVLLEVEGEESAWGLRDYIAAVYLTEALRRGGPQQGFSTLALCSGHVTLQAVSSDGRTLLLGCSDGSILQLSYRTGLGYMLSYIYHVKGAPTQLTYLGRIGGRDIYLVKTTANTIELVSFDPSGMLPPAPLVSYAWRRGLQLGVGYASATSQMLVIASAGVNVVYEFNGILSGRYNRVWPAVNFRLLVTDHRGAPVPNAHVELYYHGVKIGEGYTRSDGSIVFMQIPPDNYTVTITPPESMPWLVGWKQEISIPKMVDPDHTVTARVRLALKRFNLTIKLFDSLTGKPIAREVEVVVDGAEYGVVRGPTISLTLSYGRHEIRIRPLAYYTPTQLVVNMKSNLELPIRLERGRGTILVVAYLTGVQPPVLHTLEGTKLTVKVTPKHGAPITRTVILSSAGSATLRLEDMVYDSYRICVESSITTPACTEVELSSTRTVARLALKPVKFKLKVVVQENQTLLTPVEVNVAGIRTRIPPGRAKAEVELELPLGAYTVQVRPIAPYRDNTTGMRFHVYTSNMTRVILTRDTTVVFQLERRLGNVTLKIVDPLTGAPPTVPVRILVASPNALTRGSVTLKPGTSTVSFTAPPGELEVTIEASTYKTTKLKIVVGNQTQVRQVKLKRKNVQVSFAVVNDIGIPVPEATIEVTGVDVTYATTSITDRKGHATVSLPIGYYRVCVRATGYKTQCKDLRAISTATMEFVLSPQMVTVVKRYIPLMVAGGVIALIAAVIVVVRRKIRQITAELEEYI